MLMLLVMAASSAIGCQSTASPIQPAPLECGLGPISRPAAQCALLTAVSGCPTRRPEGARTLVGMAGCDYATGGQPCTPKPATCPLVNPSGNTSVRYLVTGADGCSGVVDVLLQASQGDGGAGIEWTMQDFMQNGATCVPRGRPHVGNGSVAGSCCATTLEVELPERHRTVRFVVQTDWTR
jgi:hypothetical protein